jgi:hypothetical protein
MEYWNTEIMEYWVFEIELKLIESFQKKQKDQNWQDNFRTKYKD